MTSLPAPPSVTSLSRDEMRSRALAFARRWAGPPRVEADAKPQNFRIDLKLDFCGECKRAEYAYTCTH